VGPDIFVRSRLVKIGDWHEDFSPKQGGDLVKSGRIRLPQGIGKPEEKFHQ
jgi:hypothetical protein